LAFLEFPSLLHLRLTHEIEGSNYFEISKFLVKLQDFFSLSLPKLKYIFIVNLTNRLKKEQKKNMEEKIS
jgi:hypothetical protein